MKRSSFFVLLTLFLTIFLFSPQAYHAQTPFLKWAELINTSPQASLTSEQIVVDNDGNIYVEGILKGVLDLDPGPGIDTISTFDSTSQTYRETGFLMKYDSLGNHLWTKVFEGTGTFLSYIVEFEFDSNGDLIAIGRFRGTIDFDPGPGVSLLSAPGNPGVFDPFLLKLDQNGNLIWVKHFAGNPDGRYSSFALDPLDNIVLVGSSWGSADFDPGPGSFLINCPTQSYYSFIQKMDGSGNFLWAKPLGNNFPRVSIASVQIDGNMNLCLSGRYLNNAAFNTPSGTITLTNNGNSNTSIVLQTDSSGNVKWVKSYGRSNNHAGTHRIVLDKSDNLILSGTYNDSASDFDPGPGTSNLGNTNGNINIYVLKLTNSGDFIWAKSMNPGYNTSYFHTTDQIGNIYLAGMMLEDSVDFDPGIGVHYLHAQNDSIPGTKSSGFFQKLDSMGNLVWVFKIGDDYGDRGSNIAIYNNNIYGAGNLSTPSYDFDPGSGVYNLTNPPGQKSPYIIALNEDTCANMVSLIDSVFDASCNNPGIIYTHAQGGTPTYNYSWNTNPISTDSFAFVNEGGVYQLTVTDQYNCSRSIHRYR